MTILTFASGAVTMCLAWFAYLASKNGVVWAVGKLKAWWSAGKLAAEAAKLAAEAAEQRLQKIEHDIGNLKNAVLTIGKTVYAPASGAPAVQQAPANLAPTNPAPANPPPANPAPSDPNFVNGVKQSPQSNG